MSEEIKEDKTVGSRYKILSGDCLTILKTLKDNSIDSLVTDPPAGISFMGKSWDTDHGGRDHWITWLSSVMCECLRVMKPGAHGLVWAIPRTSHWTATSLEDAGFEIRDVVTHLFGSGFPKSLDISKAIDKAAGAEREITKIGKSKAAEFAGKFDQASSDLRERRDIPTTPQAREWQGFGTALKPASEHWILVRKPCSEKTVAKNVLKYGTGGINIDASRIMVDAKDPNHRGPTGENGGADSCFGVGNKTRPATLTQGRFPSNLVLSCSDTCTDDTHDLFTCPIAMLDEQSGPCKTGALTGQPRVENKTYGKAGSTLGTPRFYSPGAATGASRFFYCAKASKADKNAGCEGMPKRQGGGMSGSMDKSMKTGSGNERDCKSENFHPTVKATKLMSYLIRLVTPKNGLVLDPFTGSGSTCVAALKEGFRFIGIEREPEYIKIAEARIAYQMKEVV